MPQLYLQIFTDHCYQCYLGRFCCIYSSSMTAAWSSMSAAWSSVSVVNTLTRGISTHNVHTWCFAWRFGIALRQVTRFPRRQGVHDVQDVQGGRVWVAGLSLPPRHRSVGNGHVQLQDTVDVILKAKLSHFVQAYTRPVREGKQRLRCVRRDKVNGSG